MDSNTLKRNRIEESDLYQTQESSSRSHERMSTSLPTTSNISGTHMELEAEPPSVQFQPMNGHGISRFTGSTRAVGRAAMGGANRVLSDAQIRHFITSTVIPHHRSLTRTESQVNEWYSRQEVTNSANHSSPAVSRTNMEVGGQLQPSAVQLSSQNNGSTHSVGRVMTNGSFSTNNETWHNNSKTSDEEFSRQRPLAQVSPQTHIIPKNIQTETTAVPQAIPVPQRVLDFISGSQETQREVKTAPQEIPEINNVVPEMPGQTIGVSQEASKILAMGVPREIQEDISQETCVPEIASVLHEIQGEITLSSPKMQSIQQETQGEVATTSLTGNDPQRMQCNANFPHKTLSTYDVSVHCQHNRNDVFQSEEIARKSKNQRANLEVVADICDDRQQLEETSNQIDKERVTDSAKHTYLKQKQNKWNKLKVTVMNKNKALANCRKRLNIIRSQEPVRKCRKVDGTVTGKSRQSVRKSEENEDSDKEVLSKNDEENDEIVDDDVEKFLQQFSLDKLNISPPRAPADTHMPEDVSPWDPEYALIPLDRYSCRELLGSERFVPCQDCFIDLNLFL